MHGIIVERVSCLVHSLHDLHGVWCVSGRGHWVTHSVGVSLSTPRVGPSKIYACAIHPTHPVRLVAVL